MYSQFRGLVISEIPWGENDKMVTVLTAEAGKFSFLLKGGVSLKNHYAAACTPLCYSEFVTTDKGVRAWVKEATEVEPFMNIRNSLEETALGLYICDVINEVCLENSDESEMLQLALNSLYAIDKKLKDISLIKAAFELRTAAICGFSPDLVNCSECGSDNSELMYLDVMDGVMHCSECRKKMNTEIPREGHSTLLMVLEKPMLDCMRYVSYSNAKKFLSFDLPTKYYSLFSEYCEKYLLNHIDRGFKSLDFYNSVK